MSEWICDDRLDMQALREEIKGMSDEEFEAYLEETKNETE